MQRLSSIFILAIITLVLTACGPIYKKQYAYVPPASNMGKMCTAQCVQNKNSCEQMCQMRNDNCRMQARQDAMYQFEIYRSDRLKQNLPVEKSINDFDRGSFGCQNTCGCSATYRSCYAACGGEVLERNVCVAFCDKK